MSRKESWKNFGKNTGNAFKNFGKAVAQTAKIAVGNDKNEVEENGQSKLRNAWSKTGKGFGSAGKSLGKAAKTTVRGDDEPKANAEENSTSKEGAVDVENKMKEEN